MSGLWTPSGGDPADNEPRAGSPDADPAMPEAEPSAEEIAALRELHARLVSTPVVDVIVNHALGIWQLALVHLGVVTPPDEQGRPPAADLASAGLAIDALARWSTGWAAASASTRRSCATRSPRPRCSSSRSPTPSRPDPQMGRLPDDGSADAVSRVVIAAASQRPS